MRTHYKDIVFALSLVITVLIIWNAIDVFFLAFATILLAIFLNAIGNLTKKIIHLPYVLSLMIAILFIIGVFVLIFWLYSPTIAEQFQMLLKQLPEAALSLGNEIAPYFSKKYLSIKSLQSHFSLENQVVFSKVVTIFSTTIGSIVSFAVFLIVGFYLALLPNRYLKGALFVIPESRQHRIWEVGEKIGKSLRFWLLGKVLSMISIGILTIFGLWALNIPLPFILGLLAGVLTFIPYVGPILASIPAILIAFAESPLSAVYVLVLYIGIHLAEGYLITPFIEQKTVSIPPALTIMGQILFYVLVGGIGLALATPLIVVMMALAVSLKSSTSTVKVVDQS